MNKKALSIVLFTMGAISLAIAVYQFAGSRVAEGVLSVVFTLVFVVGGVANHRRSG